LFDLIVGSGVGGVVALLVGLKRQPVSHYADFFMEYPQKIFKADFLTKLGIWIKYKYSSKTLKAVFQEMFGESTMLCKCCGPEHALVHFKHLFFIHTFILWSFQTNFN
jgi:patatin-like phospholipase/acyl hydrolase